MAGRNALLEDGSDVDDPRHHTPHNQEPVDAADGDQDDAEDLQAQEENPNDSADQSGDRPARDEQDRLNKRGGGESAGSGTKSPWNTNVGGSNGNPGLKSRFGTAKKLWLGGGILMALVSIMFAIFTFISPFKADHVIKSIESRVGEVPQNAVEHRLTYYMARYLMLRAAAKADTSFERDRAYTYIGDGVFATLYTNWKGAKLESVMESKYHMQVRPVRQVGNILGRDLVKPSNWQIQFMDSHGNPTGDPVNLDAPEMRREIRDFANKEIHPLRVLKRYHTRKVLKRYYGVNNWKPFEKTQKKVRDKYLEKKATFYKFMVKQTVGRMSTKYAAYFSCLIDGGDSCKQDHLNPPDENPPNAPNSPDIDAAVDESAGRRETSNVLTKTLQRIGMKRILASVSAGLGILQLIGGIQSAVNSGALSQVTYDNLSQQYVGYSSAIRSASDQVLAGDDFDPEDARILSETFNGFESSPVYNAGLTSGKVSAAGQWQRDCDGDGTKETTLAPGETVCPNKKLIQDREGIKKMFFWPVIDAIGGFYNSTIGKAVNFASDLFSSVLDALGVNALMSKIIEVSGLAQAAAPLLETAMNWIVGFSVTGNETDEDAYDATYAGIFAATSALGSTVGGDRSATTGGAPLTDAQVSAIIGDNNAQEQFALSKKSLFERYFSPDVQSSLTSYAIMHTPTSVTSMSSAFLQSMNPANILSSFGSLFTARSYAAAEGKSFHNPFNGLYFGYANDNPVLTMEEADLNAQYQCDKPPEDRPQNKDMGRPNGVPFDIFVKADPCLLNKVTGEAGNKFLDGSFNTLD